MDPDAVWWLFRLRQPGRIAVGGHRIWVANSYIDATGGSVTELRASDGQWIQTLSADSWFQSLLNNSCTHYLTTGGYPFFNPALIAAVGPRIWVFDGPPTILTAR